MVGASAPRRPLEDLAWYLASIACFWSFGYTTVRGNDLWWHLAAGRWTLAHREVPLTDPFSFTAAGQPWHNDSWLSDVVFALWAGAFGEAALVWWKWAVLVATFVLLVRLVRRLSDGAWPAAFAATCLAIATAAPFLDLRPHLYSFLGFVLVLELTLGRPRPPWLLCPVFLLWVNLHAGFFLGFVALGIVLALRLPGAASADRRRLVLLAGACVLAALVNPNGIEAVARPIRFAFDTGNPYRFVDEWRPPFAPGGIRSTFYPPAIAAFALGAGVVLWRRRPIPWVALALGLLTLAMSLRSRRFVPLFAIAQSLVTGPALAAVLTPALRRAPPLVLPVLALALGVYRLAPYPQSAVAFPFLVREDAFPVDTCAFVRANDLAGRVFAPYSWGGYVSHCTGGRLTVFIDGRADTVYGDERLRQWAAVWNAHPGWETIVESSGADYVLWPKDAGEHIRFLVATRRWRVLYQDTVSVLLVRATRPETPTEPPPDSAYRALTEGVRARAEGRLAEAEEHLSRALRHRPHLGVACFELAEVQAFRGRIETARRTAAECARFYPQPRRVAAFEQALRGLPVSPPADGVWPGEPTPDR